MMSDMAVAYERHRITVDEYHKMAHADIFDPTARIELLDGELIERVAPMYPPHAGAITRINRVLLTRLGDRATILCQTPVTLPDYSEPQPDFTVARLEPHDYARQHPLPNDVYFIVEAADSSLVRDQRRKLPVYARSGIPEIWLVNLVDDTVMVYRDPERSGYRSIQVLRRGETITPIALPGESFAVETLVGPKEQ